MVIEVIIGSHVSFRDTQMVGSINEALSYGANALMFYTGAPQNTMRGTINELYKLKAHELLKENNIKIEHVIVHAPYIVNLANYLEAEKYNFSISFLKKEVLRVEQLGLKYLVIHPGSSLKLDRKMALNAISLGINNILADNDSVTILLETMAGKGSECGINLEELKAIIDGVTKKNQIGICLDTCHLNDAGINIAQFDLYLKQLDEIIGIDKVKCVHLNDSKNVCGSHKDRHENIGYGTIGFDNLLNILNNELLTDVPKILETPYVKMNDKESISPYKEEIAMLKGGTFNSSLYEDIIKTVDI